MFLYIHENSLVIVSHPSPGFQRDSEREKNDIEVVFTDAKQLLNDDMKHK